MSLTLSKWIHLGNLIKGLNKMANYKELWEAIDKHTKEIKKLQKQMATVLHDLGYDTKLEPLKSHEE